MLQCCSAMYFIGNISYVCTVLCFISDVSQGTVLRNYLTSSVPEALRKIILLMPTEKEDTQENRLKTTSKV